jgi:putative membrane protein
MRIFVRWGVLALAVWAATGLVPGIKVHGGAWSYLWVALIFALINTFLGSFLKLMTLPAVILTAGLFLIVINAAMALTITNFWAAIFASIIISLVSGAGSRLSSKRNWS